MKTEDLYPLKFQPCFHYRIWGGEKLKTVLNKSYEDRSIGESWEISTVPNSETLVANGALKGKTINQLIEVYTSDFLGENVYQKFGKEFPLLIKFIDAKTPLSIQVHPNDTLAKERHNSFGKNEMWYVMEADKDAELIIGFGKKLTKDSYRTAIAQNNIEPLLNSVKVNQGDTFFIPAGRVHAIGSGVLIAEIQQTSDVTYRIFDFNRIDKKTGKQRELHTEQSVDAIAFDLIDNYKTEYNVNAQESKLVYTAYFKTNILNISQDTKLEIAKENSFKILICTDGEVTINYKYKAYFLQRGETILLPACLDQEITLSSKKATLLEVFL